MGLLHLVVPQGLGGVEDTGEATLRILLQAQWGGVEEEEGEAATSQDGMSILIEQGMGIDAYLLPDVVVNLRLPGAVGVIETEVGEEGGVRGRAHVPAHRREEGIQGMIEDR